MKTLRSRKHVVKIEPATPAKEVEVTNMLLGDHTPSLVKDMGSVETRGLRRSARLSLNSSLSNAGEIRGKRKVGNGEKCEEDRVKCRKIETLGVNEPGGERVLSVRLGESGLKPEVKNLDFDVKVMELDEEDIDSERKVKSGKIETLDVGDERVLSLGLGKTGLKPEVKNLDFDVKVMELDNEDVEPVQDGDVGNRRLSLRSGKKVSKPEMKNLDCDMKLSDNENEMEVEEREGEAVLNGVSEAVVKSSRDSSSDVEEPCPELVRDGDVGKKCLSLRSGKKVSKLEVSNLEFDVKVMELDKEGVESERKVKGRRVSSLNVEEPLLSLRSGKKVSKPEVKNLDCDVKPSANENEKETEERDGVSESVVKVGEEMGRSRFSKEEKGKGKVDEVSSSSDFSVADYLNGADDLIGEPTLADTVRLEEVTIDRGGPTSNSEMDPKERFRNIAKVNASRFAHFSIQEEDDDEDEVEPQLEETGGVEDWPGPFSTAMKIIKDRASNVPTEQKKKSAATPLIWVPKRNNRNGRVKVAPSLVELCTEIMAENVDAITSLESVPDAIRHKLTQALCDSRTMNHRFFNLLASGSPSEIRVKDCSWLNEDQFTQTFEAIDASNLTVLQLDQCGRCLPDYVLYATLNHLPNKLSALTTISLKGACRLSDAGLNALVTSASALRSINLGCCSLLTSDGIINLADKLGSVLKELYIDECFGIDAKSILPALFNLQHLEVLSISRFETVNNSFITQFVAVKGHKMKELVLADCTKLTDRAIKAIAKSCPGLCAIDLTNLSKLTDASLAHLANGCQKLETMKFCRNTFSDEAVAAYLEACGEPLLELSLNHVDKVGHNTAVSLAKHANKLQCLDLSWCREMTDEALGLIVDSCLSLKTLKLFGCTQITHVLAHGHSNENVKIIGLQGSQILKNIVAPDLLPLRYSSV